ncbi:MAG: LysM peptidoglycan-binding domain-containing protein [Chloroflexi bacterium]|nr:LysM peptidoglycan-binding domain-containing protein [Chloroflexota bacterium]
MSDHPAGLPDFPPDPQPDPAPEGASRLARTWSNIKRAGPPAPASGAGVHDLVMRYATHVLLILVAGGAVWAASLRFRGALPTAPVTPAPLPTAAAPQATRPPDERPVTALPPFNPLSFPADGAITRNISLHTDIPTRPRVEVMTYTVQTNDTLFGIAEKFGLQPETLLWGNFAVLRDDPHSLRPGQVLNILPVNGAYYQWVAGNGLNGVAEFFHVTAQDIIDWPGNHLEPDVDPANPGIVPGAFLIIPGGRREFRGWPEIPQL